MLIHNAKRIVELAPNAVELIKQASVHAHYENLHQPDNALASHLDLVYLEKVAGQTVDAELQAKTLKAIRLLGLEKEAQACEKELLDNAFKPVEDLEKAAQARVTVIEDLTQGTCPDFEKAAQLASWLLDSKFADTAAVKASKVVATYGGEGYMDKQAALGELAYRANVLRARGSEFEVYADAFEKVASIVEGVDCLYLDRAGIQDICYGVTEIEKKAQMEGFGLNFRKHVMIVGDFEKRAFENGSEVHVAGRKVPFSKISSLDYGAVQSVLGADVAQALQGHPTEVKAVLESLPLDSQKMLEALL